MKRHGERAPVKLLVLSFYYEPDLSAGSFRAASLVKALRSQLPENSHIRVMTSMPNRYDTHREAAPAEEDDGVVRITRIALPRHRSGMAGQVRAFYRFFQAVLRKLGREKEHYDVVFATSSRLFTGFLGALIARQYRIPMYLDIRDLFVDTLHDVLAPPLMKILEPLLGRIERFTLHSAKRVNLVSAGFLPWYKARYPDTDCDVFTNGIDTLFLESASDSERLRLSPADKKIVFYAGNMGEGQGLEKIIPSLATRARDTHHFVLVGDGGRKQALEAALTAAGITNVTLRPPVPRRELVGLYADADILFLHLNDGEAFRKVLPSKLFEYAVFAKPIVAGVAGFSSQFLASELPDAMVFPPCDPDAAYRALMQARAPSTSREDFIRRYARSGIMEQLAGRVLALASSPIEMAS